MSFRRTLWRVFQSNPFWFSVNLLLFRQQLQPWVAAIIHQPLDRFLRALVYSIGLSVLLLGLLRGRTLWPKVRKFSAKLTARAGDAQMTASGTITPPTGDLTLTGYAPTVAISSPPIGTIGNLAMAMQPTFRPQFLNNSQWRHWEAANEEAHRAAQANLYSQMHRNVALLS